MKEKKLDRKLFFEEDLIKVKSFFFFLADGSGTIMIRACSLDSGTLTTDTEIVRMSNCGSFYFEEKYVHGCVQSCDDVDACNASENVAKSNSLFILMLMINFIKGNQ